VLGGRHSRPARGRRGFLLERGCWSGRCRCLFRRPNSSGTVPGGEHQLHVFNISENENGLGTYAVAGDIDGLERHF
jgi:hypothetical protein